VALRNRVVANASYGSSVSGSTVTADTELPAAITINDAVPDTIVAPVIGAIPLIYDAGTPDYNRIRSANNLSDAAAGGTFMPVASVIYNGTTFDRQRSPTGDAVAVTGIAASGGMVWNGATWDRMKGDSSGTGRVGVASRATGVSQVDASTNTPNVLTSDSNGAISVVTYLFTFNGTTWDRVRNNTDVTLLASSSRTTTQTSASIPVYNAQGITVWMNTTSVGTSSNTLSVVEVDPVSAVTSTLLASAAISGNGMTRLHIYPGVTVAANASASVRIPRNIQIIVTAGNGNASTYSVGYGLLI
jgi:hypothetical protein